MSNSNLHGWKRVFLFTFKEEFKQKSYRIALSILFVVSLLSMPFMSLINSEVSEGEMAATDISSITVYDETGLGIDYDNALTEEKYKDVVINDSPQQSYDEKIKELKDAEASKEIVINLSFSEEGYYEMTVANAPDCDVSVYDIEATAEDFQMYFNKARLQALNVTEEQVEYMTEAVDFEVIYISEEGDIQDAGPALDQTQYTFLYIIMMAAVLIIAFSGQKLATSIITEKSTRVIEYLAINVKPLALLVGKLFATLSLIMLQAAAVVVGVGLSVVLNKVINGGDAQSNIEMISDMLECLKGLSPLAIIIAVLVIFVGTILYDLLAGLVGATVNKLEELDEGMKLFNAVALIGAYMGIGLAMVEMAGDTIAPLKYACVFIPISAPFIVPAYLLMGKISIVVALASLVVLAVITILMFKFTATAFIVTIMYQGNKLKIKDVINLVKNKPVESEGV